MKSALIVTSIVFIFTSCRAYIPLKNETANIGLRYQTSSDDIIVSIKNALLAENAVIVDQDASTITAELHKSKWAWETKKGKPDNSTGYVVVKKLYDIGANQVRRPKEVTTIWTFSIGPDRKSYLVKMTDAVSIYYNGTERSGYSTGLFEKMIAAQLK